MQNRPPRRTREEIARIEIGHTDVSRRVALVLVLSFLLTVVGVPVAQQTYDLVRYLHGDAKSPCPLCSRTAALIRTSAELPGRGLITGRLSAANRATLRAIRTFEDELEDSSVVSHMLRPWAQLLLTRWLGAGNEKVVPGSDDWLFFAPALAHLTGPPFLDPGQLARRRNAGDELSRPPQPDPRPAILQFHKQLADRGIRLVLMPVPVKASVLPERLARSAGPLVENPSHGPLMRELGEAGVDVFDPTAILASDAASPGYLATDTHWRPEAMERVAAALARHLRNDLRVEPGFESYELEEATVTGTGDLARILDLPPLYDPFPRQTVTIHRVITESDTLWRPTPGAEVLLLGDSFANVFSIPGMGWGEAAGLAEQLSYELGRPVDVLARNDDGAFASRALLSRELAHGRDRLAASRVVIWEMTARELSLGDWKLLPMRLGKTAQRGFFVPAAGTSPIVSGTIAEMGDLPRPRSAPYADHVVALLLVDLAADEADVAGKRALVFMRSMADFELTPVARLRPGDQVTVRLRPWDEVANSYAVMSRSELDDPELLFAPPVWGEEEQP